MKKTVIFLFFLTLVILGGLALAKDEEKEPPSVYFNGVQADVSPIVKDGIIYVPLEGFCEAVGFHYDYDAEMNRVDLKFSGQGPGEVAYLGEWAINEYWRLRVVNVEEERSSLRGTWIRTIVEAQNGSKYTLQAPRSENFKLVLSNGTALSPFTASFPTKGVEAGATVKTAVVFKNMEEGSTASELSVQMTEVPQKPMKIILQKKEKKG